MTELNQLHSMQPKIGVYIETLFPPCFEFPRFHLLALLWKFPFSNIAQHDNPIIQ